MVWSGEEIKYYYELMFNNPLSMTLMILSRKGNNPLMRCWKNLQALKPNASKNLKKCCGERTIVSCQVPKSRKTKPRWQ